MITAAKLEQFTKMSSNRLTSILQDQGYDTINEPILFVKFKGIRTPNGTTLDFVYTVTYLDTHVTNGLVDANIIVTYDSPTDTLHADYAG